VDSLAPLALGIPMPERASEVKEFVAEEPDALAAALAAFAGGRSDALAEIYDLTAGDLYGLALWRTGSREDAQDAVQEVFVRLARAGEALTRVNKPRAYLLAMVHRAAVDLLRRRRPTVAVQEALLQPVVEDRERAADAARLSGLLLRLPVAQREALYLRHFGGLSFSEIASVTGVPTFTAASRCRLGLRRLRRLLGVEQ
jgi:RNA polymerase sigma-70 factor, ECF subfamily